MEFETSPGEPTTLTFSVPDQATFEQLIDLVELPEAVLEVVEVRELTDEYLDTTDQTLLGQGSAARLATVGVHHFLIYQRPSGTKVLPSVQEFVERLTPAEHAAQRAGDRSHERYQTIQADVVGVLAVQLTRRSTFASKLFRVGETRFELGLEAVTYAADGRSVADRLIQLELIEGDGAVVQAIGVYLAEEYGLATVTESAYQRSQRLMAAATLTEDVRTFPETSEVGASR